MIAQYKQIYDQNERQQMSIIEGLPGYQHHTYQGQSVYQSIQILMMQSYDKQELIYVKKNYDYGPHNLYIIFTYVFKVKELLSSKKYMDRILFHFTGRDKRKKLNALSVLLAYGSLNAALIDLSENVSYQTYFLQGFVLIQSLYTTDCNLSQKINHCLQGFAFALAKKWITFQTFNYEQFHRLSKKQNGQITFIIPNKLLLFSDPYTDQQNPKFQSNKQVNVNKLADIFYKMNVTAVFRFCQKNYKENVFKKSGLKFYDLFQGTDQLPSEQGINRFMKLSRKQYGVLALHCKQGTQLSGLMAAIYIIQQYGMMVDDCVGWIRECRAFSLQDVYHDFLRRRYQNKYYFKQQVVGKKK